MTRTWYAVNARDLLEHRRQGHMPARPVSVVLDGGEAEHPVLYLRDDMPIGRMDWRMLVNLEVWVWASPRTPLERLTRVARDIAEVIPARLVVRFTDPRGQLHDVEVGSGTHSNGFPEHGIAPEHDFIWCPINLSGTFTGTRLKRALH